MDPRNFLLNTRRTIGLFLLLAGTGLVIETWTVISHGIGFSSVNIVIFAALLLLLLIASKASRLFAKQIGMLLNTLQSVAESGDYSQRINVEGNALAGDSTDHFNRLMRQFGDVEKEAVNARNNFEEKIISLSSEVSELRNKLKQSGEDLSAVKDEAASALVNKSRFLANMSHEIRTPMNGVLGMTELLLGTELSVKQRRFAETVRRSAEGLLNIINDILDFSRIESGKLMLELVDFKLRETVEDVVELLADPAQQKGIELVCHIPNDLTNNLRGDAGRLRQVLTNIIGNAVKFTNEGEVLVRVSNISDSSSRIQFKFEVIDTGTGISPEMQSRIFDSFSQADTSTTRRYGGTGLGLTISKELVTLMGGVISVDSIPGKGSRFQFTVEFEPQNHAVDARDESTSLIQGVRILSVDDNETNRSILDYQLTAWGISNNCASDGAQALQMLHQAVEEGRPFSAAILDMHMPNMDGLELARTISSDPAIASVKLMMLTSAVLDLDAQQMRDVGILQYLSKPARQSQLYNCLVGMLGKQLDPNQVMDEASQQGFRKLPCLEANVLVAEDNPVNQEVVLSMLELFGCQAHLVENGEAAIQAVRNNGHYDIILMDCQMPLKDGYDATAEIRKMEREKNNVNGIPVIALTANALEGDRERCLIAGMNDYLSKPFKQEHLHLCLKRWLSDRSESTGQEEISVQLPEQVQEARTRQIDENALETIKSLQRPDRPDILAKVVGLYLDNSPKTISKLKESIENKEPDGVRSAAHSLKSSSANLGAKTLATQFKNLEEMGREQSIEGAMDILMEVEKCFAQVVEELEPYVQKKA